MIATPTSHVDPMGNPDPLALETPENSIADRHSEGRISDVVPKKRTEIDESDATADGDPSFEEAISDAINAITIPPSPPVPSRTSANDAWAGEVTITRQADALTGTGETVAKRGILPPVRAPQPRSSSSSLPPPPVHEPPTIARRAEGLRILKPLPETDPETLTRRPDRPDFEDDSAEVTFPKPPGAMGSVKKLLSPLGESDNTDATLLRRDALPSSSTTRDLERDADRAEKDEDDGSGSITNPKPAALPTPAPLPTAVASNRFPKAQTITEAEDNATRIQPAVPNVTAGGFGAPNVTAGKLATPQPSPASQPLPPQQPHILQNPVFQQLPAGHPQHATWIPFQAPQHGGSAHAQWPAHRVALIVSVSLLAVAIFVLAIRPRASAPPTTTGAQPPISIAVPVEVTPVPAPMAPPIEAQPAPPVVTQHVASLPAAPPAARQAPPPSTPAAKRLSIRAPRPVIPSRREQ